MLSYVCCCIQGYLHEWVLPVARLHQSSYHLRAAKAVSLDFFFSPKYSKCVDLRSLYLDMCTVAITAV